MPPCSNAMSAGEQAACEEACKDPSEAHDESKVVLPAAGSAEVRMCRVCFAQEGDEDAGQGDLIAPCKCIGTVKYIHRGCLYGWLAQLHAHGLHQKAKRCEICHAPWDPALVPMGPDGPGSGQGWQLPGSEADQNNQAAGPYRLPRILQRRLRRLLYGICAAARTQPWPVLLFRIWRLYVIATAVGSAVKGGATGLRSGVRLGRSLVQEQSSAVVGMLAALAEMLGTPVAEMLWIQVVAAVGCALASEFLYSVALGGLLGSVFGFVNGYASALRNSASVAAGAVTRVTGIGSQLARHGWKLLTSLSAAAFAMLRRSGAVRALTLNLL